MAKARSKKKKQAVILSEVDVRDIALNEFFKEVWGSNTVRYLRSSLDTNSVIRRFIEKGN